MQPHIDQHNNTFKLSSSILLLCYGADYVYFTI